MKDLKDVSVSLAQYIKAKRTENGLTQEQLATEANIDYKHIQNIESLRRINDPKLSTLSKLADALNITVSDITDHIY